MATLPERTDRALLKEIGNRLARHRLNRNLTQEQVAHEAGVSKRTVVRLENGESSQLTNLIRVVRALGLAGGLDALVPPPQPSPVAQLRSREKERRRASPGTRRAKPSAGWTWYDDGPKRGGRP